MTNKKMIIFILILIILIPIIGDNYNMLISFFSDNVSEISTFISTLALIVLFLNLLEIKKQRRFEEDPFVSLKIVPDKSNSLLNVIMKNTGGSPAYNVSVSFKPDLPYHDTSLNKLKIFNNMPFLDKGEKVEFLFDSTIDYFNAESPINTTEATITYFKSPYDYDNNKNPEKHKIKIELDERKGQLNVRYNTMHNLVKEVQELKQGLLLILAQMEENND